MNYVLVLNSGPEDVVVFGPFTSFDETLKMAELYRDSYPNAQNLVVPIQSPDDALRQLPTRSTKQ